MSYPAPTSPCANCPREAIDCDAIRLRIGRYCATVDPTDPAFQPDMIPILRGEPHPFYARAGIAAPAPGAATIDPVALAIDLCEFRASCQTCDRPIRCLAAGLPGLVSLAVCRVCKIKDAS